jgi:predicted nucleic acid-binding protein
VVLIDSSVWIRAFLNRTPYAQQLPRVTAARAALGHEFIYGELSMGDRGGRSAFLATYDKIPWAGTISHREVAHLVRLRNLHGRGLSWIDAHLLASAMAERAGLWTADERLAAIAGELGVGYEPVHNEH